MADCRGSVKGKLRRRKSKQESAFWQFSTNHIPKRCPFWRNRNLNSVSFYLTWIFVCLLTYLLTSVFWQGWGGGLLLGKFAQLLQLFQPCYGPVLSLTPPSPYPWTVRNWGNYHLHKRKKFKNSCWRSPCSVTPFVKLRKVWRESISFVIKYDYSATTLLSFYFNF